MTAPDASSAAGLRALLAGPGLSFAWFSIGSVPVVEIGARRGCDAAVIDLQHGLWDRMTTHLAVSALRDVPIVVRVAAITTAAIGEALDSGAVGILVPLVDTAEQAEAAVAAATFPPQGNRSGGGVRPLAQGFPSYVATHSRPLIGLMIETVAGVDNAAAIAAVPGVDFIFIGTGDLALSLGCFPARDERHEQACQAVRSACREAGVPCGIFTLDAAEARSRREQGFAITVAANDIDIIARGFAGAHELLDQSKGTT